MTRAPETARADSWPITAAGFPRLRLGEERLVVRERFGAYRAFRRTPDAPESDQFLLDNDGGRGGRSGVTGA